MRGSRHSRSQSRPGLVAAALAALALLIQALIPAAAIAHDAASGAMTLSVCTAEGLKTVTVGAAPAAPAGKHFMGLHCTACAFANFAALDGRGDGALAAVTVRYAQRTVIFHPERAHAAARARAPPRPPGQGPPARSIV
ncbi:MAG: hypothetical protein JWP35_2631 [Caulobacter sp.]|nr:hypothetical protein [Caulobacter sp.]